MLCPSCNKFAAFDTSSEPEANLEVTSELEDVDGSDTPNPDRAKATVSGDVRIVLTSECCGDEMKETTFEVSDVVIELERAPECACDLTELEVEGSGEITDRSESSKTTVAKRGPNKGKEVTKSIPYRYQRRFYGADVGITVSCGCGKTEGSEIFSDECQASGMDELV